MIEQEHHSNNGNISSEVQYSYPNDTTQIITDWTGTIIKKYNVKDQLIFVYDNKHTMAYYEFRDDDTPKTCTWYKNNDRLSNYIYKYHFKFNENGDWIECLIDHFLNLNLQCRILNLTGSS